MSARQCPFPINEKNETLTTVPLFEAESIPAPARRCRCWGGPAECGRGQACSEGNCVGGAAGSDLRAEDHQSPIDRGLGSYWLWLRTACSRRSIPSRTGRRRTASQCGVQSALRKYHPSMLRTLHDLTDAWDSAPEPGERVDVASDANKLPLGVIGLSGFGQRLFVLLSRGTPVRWRDVEGSRTCEPHFERHSFPS